ncbi:uncharacterized protein LOC108090657 isoform X2 [Drosophila ficusphila]|uniref:uncharacterized protein LOC108090657 isoform X2 n=1 Tax=Drosophila ficusphila TaxID=30025 RepID=UPI0007E62BAB|nr:uncharacterized protein LOC108090657 isoform X2 [Drosophila ficusphila]
MNILIVLVVVSVFLNFIEAAPNVDISNEELMDGKYLCEGNENDLRKRFETYISALRQFGNGNSDDLTATPLLNDYYKLFLRDVNRFLSKNKNFEGLQEKLSRAVSKRGLDSIGGGHLIKRTENRRLLSD